MTERLLLRKLKLSDSKDMFEYTSDPEVSKYVGWNKHDNIEETKNYLKNVINQYDEDNPYVWGIELKSERKLIGTIEFSLLSNRHKWCELDSDMNRRYWNKGYNTEALKAVINFVFTNLDLNKVQARCYVENVGSSKVLQKAGMIYEGVQRQHMLVNGTFHDMLRYSILREEFDKM